MPNQPKSWYQVSYQVPSAKSELIADQLAELSGNGVCTDNRCVDTFSTDEIADSPLTTITAWFNAPCAISDYLAKADEVISRICGSNPDFSFQPAQYSLIGDDNWTDSWKAHFKPLAIGKRLIIAPSWENICLEDGQQLILLDPGMAFGTGGHETTRLCLHCLEDLPAEQLLLPVLDLGTGSGILAIAAAKLGASQVDAVDIDPQAVEIATANCHTNNVGQQVHCSCKQLAQLPCNYGIIMANILAETLVEMAGEIFNKLQADGQLILSGILAEKEQYVIDGFKALPLELKNILSDGEWRCLHYQRSA